jgi:hypothetical protein
MAQIEVQPGSNITVTVNKGPLSGGLPAGSVGALQFNKDGQRFGTVLPATYDEANTQLTLGSVGTVVLAGGNQGEVITNVGDGVMSWRALDGISNNLTSVNTEIDNVSISVGNEPGVAVFTESDFTFRGNILPDANITYDLGSPTQRWRDLYLSNSTIDLNGVRISSDGTDLVAAGGLIVQGQMFAREFYGNISGDFLSGDGSQIYNIDGSQITGAVSVSIDSGTADTVRGADQPNITSVGNLTSLTVEGPVDLGATGNITLTGGSNGQFLQSNGSGGVQFATVSVASIVNATVTTTKIEAKQHSANITVDGGAVAEFGNSIISLRRNTNLAGNLVVSANVTANVVTANSITTTAFSANGAINLHDIANVKLEGGDAGQSIVTNGLGTIAWSDLVKLKNGSSNVVVVENDWIHVGVAGSPDVLIVKETGLKVSPDGDSDLGNIARANYFYGNTIAATNFDLGNVEDVTLNGGNLNEVLRTDGAGNLSFHFIDETLIRDSGTGASNVQTTANSVVINANGISDIVTVYKDGSEGRVDIVGNTHVGGTLFMNTGNVNGSIDVLGDATIGGNLTVSGNITYLESTTLNVGDKNITLAANAATAAEANGGGITLSGANAYMNWDLPSNTWTFSHSLTANLIGSASNANYSNFAGTAYALDADLANVSISGGNSAQVLSTDGNGVLAWTTMSAVTGGNAISGNSSSVSVFDDGNVGIQINGTANVTLFSDIGITTTGLTADAIISGEANITGDVTAVNFYGVHRGAQQILVVNKSGGALAVGDVVYISGSQGMRMAVGKASNTTEALSATTIGVIAVGGDNNAECYATISGVLVGVDTAGLTEGSPIYLGSSAGTWTTTQPVSPAHLVALGFVQRAHQTQGEFYISINNFQELAECSDVLLPSNIANISNRAILSFDSANSVWVDGTLDMGTY